MFVASWLRQPSVGSDEHHRLTQACAVAVKRCAAAPPQPSAPSAASAPGTIWNHFLSTLDELGWFEKGGVGAVKNRKLHPHEILHRGSQANIQRVLLQEESGNESGSPPRYFVAKFISGNVWHRICSASQQHSSASRFSTNKSMLGKDLAKTETYFVRECLSCLWLTLLSSASSSLSSSSASTSSSSSPPAPPAPRPLKLRGVGWHIISGNNDDDSSSDSGDIKLPCLIFDEAVGTLADVCRIIKKRLRVHVDHQNKNSDEQQRQEEENEHNQMQQQEENEDQVHRMESAAALCKKLTADLYEGLFVPLQRDMPLAATTDGRDAFRLCAHMDICPSNILVALDDDDSAVTFSLADWGCSVWSTCHLVPSLSNNDVENNDSNMIDRPKLPEHLFCDGGVISRYGTPPFADEQILELQTEFLDDRDKIDDVDDDDDDKDHRDNKWSSVCVKCSQCAPSPSSSSSASAAPWCISAEFARASDGRSLKLVTEWVMRTLFRRHGRSSGCYEEGVDDEDDSDDDYVDSTSVVECKDRVERLTLACKKMLLTSGK